MLENYLKLRLQLLLKASIQNLDIGALVTGLLLFLVFFKTDNAIWYGLISSSILLLIHFSRKDTDFLKNILGKQFHIGLVTEYVLIWVIINLFFIFKSNDFIYLETVLLCFILPFIRFRQFFINPKFIYKIPSILLEWRAFIRKNIILSIFFFLSSCLLGYHPATLILFLGIWIHLLLKVYSFQESKELLIIQFSNIRLQKKLLYSSVFCLIFSLPAMITFMMINPSIKIYSAYFILYIFIINYVIILHKYSGFNEKIKKNEANEMEFFKFSIMIFLVIPALIYILYTKKTVSKKVAQYV